MGMPCLPGGGPVGLNPGGSPPGGGPVSTMGGGTETPALGGGIIMSGGGPLGTEINNIE
jgi:hypothetical protein